MARAMRAVFEAEGDAGDEPDLGVDRFDEAFGQSRPWSRGRTTSTSTSAELNKSLPTTIQNQGPYFKSSFLLPLGTAALTPVGSGAWLGTAGKAWVRVQITSRLDFNYILYKTSWSSPFLTVTADGAPIPAAQGDPGDEAIAIPVSATTKTLQLTENPTLKFNSNEPGAVPNSGAAVFRR